MPAITEKQSRQLRKTLAKCELFNSHERLVEFFKENNDLSPWREIPLRPTSELRIKALIAWLQDKYHPASGKNGLLMFLGILCNTVVSPTYCAELDILIAELTSILIYRSED